MNLNTQVLAKYIATHHSDTTLLVTKRHELSKGVYKGIATGRANNQSVGFFFKEKDGLLIVESPNENIKGLVVKQDFSFTPKPLSEVLGVPSKNSLPIKKRKQNQKGWLKGLFYSIFPIKTTLSHS